MEVGKYKLDENLSLKEIFNLQEMNISVGIIGLPSRVDASLVGAGVNNFSKLINTPIKDLIRIKSFGVTSLTKIIEMLESTNLIELDANKYSGESEKGYLSRYDFLISFNIKNDREKEMLMLRNQGMTLDEIGQNKKLTRERVRQIESKSIKKIIEVINNDNELISYLYSIADKGFLRTSTIEEIMNSKNNYIFIYCLKNKSVKGIYYIEEYDAFLINGNKEQLESIKSELPLIIKKDALNDEINKIVEKNDVSQTLIYDIITKSYDEYKYHYGNRSINVYDMSSYIVNEKFSGKIKITNKEKLLELATLMDEYFGTEYKNALRALQARVMGTFVLIDRGTYAAEKYSNYSIDKQELNKIKKYITNYKRNALPLEALYSAFKNDLISANITNRYIFQSVFKKCMGNKYQTSRDYIYKSDKFDYAEEVVKYVKEYKRLVPFRNILKEFSEVKPHTVIRCLLSNKIINAVSGYIHKDNIFINKNEWNYIEKEVCAALKDGDSHHIEDIYKFMPKSIKEILVREKFDLPNKFYFLLKGYCGDKFTFSRPYVAKLGTNIEKGYDKLLKEMIRKKETNIFEMPMLKAKYNVTINSLIEFIDSNVDKIVFANNKKIVSLESLKLNDEEFSNLDEVLDEFVGGENVKSLYRFDMYDLLPHQEIDWNPWLLYSIIKLYSDKYNSITTTNYFKSAVPLIVNNDYQITEKDKEEFYGDIEIRRDEISGIDDIEDLLDEEMF